MFSNVHQFLSEFSRSTTVHGVNYFGDRRRHWIERVFWIIVFVMSMTVCFFMVNKIYVKWQSSPIIVTQDDKLTAISEIPFPAVTVCPAAKVKFLLSGNLTRTQDILIDAALQRIMSITTFESKNSESFKFNEDELKAMGLTEEDLLLLEATDQICPIKSGAVDLIESRLNPHNVTGILKMYALSWYDVFSLCSLKGVYKDDIFERVFTERGICYTFNGLRNFDIFKEKS